MTVTKDKRAYPLSTSKSTGRFDNSSNAKVSVRGKTMTGIDDLLGPYGKFSSSPAGIYTPGLGYLKTLGNLLTWNKDLSNGAWGKTDCTVLPNQTGYDGITNSAWTVTEGVAGTGGVGISSANVTAGSNITVSLILKRGNIDWVRVKFAESTGTDGYNAWFNLNTGVIGTLTAFGAATQGVSTITNIGSGFFLVNVSCKPNASFVTPSVVLQSATADNNAIRVNNSTYIVASSGIFKGVYTASKVAALGIPWTMGTASVNITNNGNLYSASHDYTNAAWNKSNSTISTGFTAPDGSLTASKIISGSITNRISVSRSITAPYAGKITVSVYAKAAEWSKICVFHDNTYYVEGQYWGSGTFIDLNTGVSTVPSVAYATPAGNGWWRITTTVTTTTTAHLISIVPMNNGATDVNTVVGDGVSGVYIWGTQAEMGTVSTSYKSTVAALAQTTVTCPVYNDVHAYVPGQGQVSYGPELLYPVTSSNGWGVTNPDATHVVTFSASGLRYQSDTTSPALSASQITLTIGKSYIATGYVSNYVSGVIKTDSATAANLTIASGAGAFSVPFVASSTTFNILRNTTNVDMTFSSLSVREVITSSSVVSGLTAGNYLLSDGSTGYAAVDGPDGLVLDAAGSVGSELVTNLATAVPLNANGTVVASSSQVASTCTVNGAYGAQPGIASVIGKAYVITGNITANSAGKTVYLDAGGTTMSLGTTLGPFTRIQPYSTAIWQFGVQIANGLVGESFTVAGLSIKEVTGIHATPAGAAGPNLRRGLYNLLTYSQDFTNAAWVKTNTGDGTLPVVTPNYATDPLGGNNATRLQLVRAGGTGLSRLMQTITASGSATTQAWYMRTTDGSTQTVGLRDALAGQQNVTVTGAWQVFPLNIAAGSNEFSILTWSSMAGTSNTCDLLIYRAGLFTGTLTAAQILALGGIPLTTSAAASNPNAGSYSMEYVAANLCKMTLGSVPFQMADDHWVVVAFKLNSAVTLQGVVFPGVGGGTGSFIASVSADSTNGCVINYKNDAATLSQRTVGTIALGEIVVVALKCVSGVATGYKNLTPAATISPTGVYTLTTSQIGQQASFNYMDGNIFHYQCGKGTISDADLLTEIRYAGSVAGLSL